MHRLRKTVEMPINPNEKLAKSYTLCATSPSPALRGEKNLVQTLLNHADKLIKQIPAIVWTRSAFWVVLNGEGGLVF